MIRNKKGAIEMTMGTIVTIVLMVAILVVLLFFIGNIRDSGTDAISGVDDAIQNQINKLFTDGQSKISVYPADREINVKRGDDPKGFAFSLQNDEVVDSTFTYTLTASDVTKCGATLTEDKANDFLLGGTGSFKLGPSEIQGTPRLIKFDIPEAAPACTLIYDLDVTKTPERGTASHFVGVQIFVTIK